jgi:hypothetical protein
VPWGIAIAGIATLGAGYMQSEAGKDAANAQGDANAAAIAEDRRQYDQSRTDQMPFMLAGYDALDKQKAFLSGDWSGFQDSPDYAFAVDQGFKGLNRNLAAGGAYGSGGGDADRIALGQGLATQYAGNYWNKLAGRAGQGQTSVGQIGQLGAGMAGRIGGYMQDSGNARASAYANSANAWGNAGNQLAGLAGQYWQNQQFGGV